jgi:prepilin-type N-terminal cleavage/methylation domain-containing protein
MSARRTHFRLERGFSLVELMVAMAIGLVLVLGAVFVYSQSRTTYSVNETTARMQEKGRYVMQLLEPDIQLAGYLGFTDALTTYLHVANVAPSLTSQTSVAYGPLPAIAHACGPNFLVDPFLPVQGTNNAYFDAYPGAVLQASCNAQGGGARAGSDTLTIRHAGTVEIPATANRLQVYASRLQTLDTQLFFNGTAPGPVTPTMASVRDLIVDSYYVSQNSQGLAGFPALRVKRLNFIVPGSAPGASDFVDDEVMSGVEDFQVQFGIDTGDYDNDGVIDPGIDSNGDGVPDLTDGFTTRYVNPDSPLATTGQIVAVRLWLRIRGDQIEPGFMDPGPYNYADVVNWVPNATERKYRRILVMKTIMLRNARNL